MNLNRRQQQQGKQNGIENVQAKCQVFSSSPFHHYFNCQRHTLWSQEKSDGNDQLKEEATPSILSLTLSHPFAFSLSLSSYLSISFSYLYFLLLMEVDNLCSMLDFYYQRRVE